MTGARQRQAPGTDAIREKLAKAEQAANLLVSDLREAHRGSEPLLEIVLLPLLEQAARLEQSLKVLNRAAGQSQGAASRSITAFTAKAPRR